MLTITRLDVISIIHSRQLLNCITWAPYTPQPECVVQRINAIINHTLAGQDIVEAGDMTVFSRKLLEKYMLDPSKSIVMLTSVPQTQAHVTMAYDEKDDIKVIALCTVGLTNAISIHGPSNPYREEIAGVYSRNTIRKVGTVNIAVVINKELSEPALAELIALVSSVKTYTLAETQGIMRYDEKAIMTGTDCITVASTLGENYPLQYAGMSTIIGVLTKTAVRESLRKGIAGWKARQT